MFKFAVRAATHPTVAKGFIRNGMMLVLAAALSALTACQHPRTTTQSPAAPSAKPAAAVSPKPPASTRPARTITPVPPPSEQMIGRVNVIGARGSFVLIETSSALVTAAVPAGCPLQCHPVGLKGAFPTANLRVSPERRPPFLVADVVSGTPTVGDGAYYVPDAASTPASAPTAAPPPTNTLFGLPTPFPAATP